MPVRLINTTTRLPADKMLEQKLMCVMAPELKDALWHLYVPSWPGDAPIDIFLVNELDKDDDETDILGVYCRHYTKYHRSTIQVCPEKVMEHAKQTIEHKKGSGEKAIQKSDLARAYAALFCKVVIHELSHALMDNFRTRSREYESWHFLSSIVGKDDHLDYFKNALPPQVLSASNCKDCQYLRGLNLADTKAMRHVIEESLANAIALKQNYGVDEQNFIEKFVSGQAPAYKAGLKWNLSLSGLLNTASCWSAWKDSLFENSLKKIATKYDYSKDCSPESCLIHRLLAKDEQKEEKAFSKECFEAEFKKHTV
jgi:hypothetical protein